MSAVAARRTISWPMLLVPLLMGATVLACGLARQEGFATNLPPAPAASSYLLQFSDMPGGGVAIYNAADGRMISSIAPGGGGFIRSTVRSLDGVRARENIGEYAPFRLTLLTDNHLTLTDTATGQMLDLEAFGHTNEGEFAKIAQAAGALR